MLVTGGTFPHREQGSRNDELPPPSLLTPTLSSAPEAYDWISRPFILLDLRSLGSAELSLDLPLPYCYYPRHSRLENSAEAGPEPSRDHKRTLPDFPQSYLSPPLGMGIRVARSGVHRVLPVRQATGTLGIDR